MTIFLRNLDCPPTSSAPLDTVQALVIYADDLHAFTYPAVAERLGVSVATVEREVARGELQEKRIGRNVRITASSLRRYLEGGAA